MKYKFHCKTKGEKTEDTTSHKFRNFKTFIKYDLDLKLRRDSQDMQHAIGLRNAEKNVPIKRWDENIWLGVDGG